MYIYISGSACSTGGVHSQAWSTSVRHRSWQQYVCTVARDEISEIWDVSSLTSRSATTASQSHCVSRHAGPLLSVTRHPSLGRASLWSGGCLVRCSLKRGRCAELLRKSARNCPFDVSSVSFGSVRFRSVSVFMRSYPLWERILSSSLLSVRIRSYPFFVRSYPFANG
jgi:hypothetical protein